ncbi:MAG: hypothetical protein Unbinned5089contig1000_9 [Prokaryotic dsDNA virus sp.]|nr:MAG: hypothetical protein Unbinned5089contig1000_9 [Prokaryotic dsDNA virus sp.]|tara:strand:- start:4667 stop:5614 length:948 start_codon:yes stop_codon:yes gene_type:complete
MAGGESLNTPITTTYAGEFAGKYISAALLSGSTLANNLITIKPNVKYKEVLKKVATGDIVANADCDFSESSGVLTLTERILQPEEFQVNLEVCKKDFVSDWEAVQMGYSAYSDLPPSFSDFLIAHVADKVAQKVEQTIWNGTNATAGEFDGFLTTLGGDSDVNDVTTSETSVTSANVIQELGATVDLIPSTVYGKEDLTIYVASNVYRAYVRALGGFASQIGAAGTDNKGTQWFNGGALTFDGINVELAKGLPSNKMVAAEKSNLYFGTGLLSDHNEVKVIDMADIDGSQNVRIVMRYTAGIQHGIGGDIVLYSI